MTLQLVYSKEAPKPVGPYSQAVIAGEWMFISGIIPINPENGVLEFFDGDAAKQASRILTTLRRFLESQDLKLDTIVKTTLFLKNMKDFEAVNQVYAEYFGHHKPARSTVEVSRLPKDVLVELEAIAYLA
jgi:2-iminobutanoate/2-iminopropanoate deaminase